MAENEAGQERTNVLQRTSQFWDHVVSPTTDGLGPPGPPSVAWLATHVAASVVFSATVLAGSITTHPAQCFAAMGWLAAHSGLVARVGKMLIAGEAPLRANARRIPSWIRWGPTAKGGASLTSTLMIANWLRPIGLGALGGFLAVVAITTGARIAGLDAWADEDRPPNFYVRTVLSLRGFVAMATIIALSALLIWLTARLFDPHIVGNIESAGRIIGRTWSRREQFVEFTVGLLALTPPSLAVCESISAIGRYHRRVGDQLESQARRIQRAEIASVLHDRVVTLANEVRLRCIDSGHRKLALDLENELRQIQLGQDETREERSIRVCLRRGLEMATIAGVDVHLQSTADTLDRILPGEQSWVLERLVLVHIANSHRVQARNAFVRLLATDQAIEFGYHDDGPGFDPEKALTYGGGLASVRNDVADLGGQMTLVEQNGAVLAMARWAPA